MNPQSEAARALAGVELKARLIIVGALLLALIACWLILLPAVARAASLAAKRWPNRDVEIFRCVPQGERYVCRALIAPKPPRQARRR
jgi:hypothetical protein